MYIIYRISLKCSVNGFLLGIRFGVPFGFLNRVPVKNLYGLDKGCLCGSISYLYVTLRVHVPKQYILRPQCTYIGTTLRPMCILYEYMDP